MPKNTKKTVLVRKQAQKKTQKSRQKITKEVGLLGKALRSLGGLGGGALGGMMGMPMAGSAAGTSLGAAISKWLGSGDYSVGSNSIVSQAVRGSASIPDMHRNDQSVVIRHKEFLGEIRSNTTFTINQSFELNPGLTPTFPWLARIATRFQEYRIRGMVFHYVPSSGSAIASTNNALGTVMLQTSYRSNDTPPSSKVELLNEYWSSEAVPSEPFCHPIECDPAENPFNIQYVRSGVVPTGDNKLLYDLGVTHVATSGQQQSGVVLGDLWVSYEVELKKPLIDSNVTDPVQSVVAVFSSGTATNWFGGGANTTLGNLLLSTNGARGVSFPKGSVGSYLITVQITANSTTGTMVAPPTLTNCAAYGAINPFFGTSSFATVATGNTNTIIVSAAITISDPAVVAVVDWAVPTVLPLYSQCILYVTQLA